MNPYRDLEDSSTSATPHLAYEDIATKLLKDQYFLTALELHTELVESGKELPQLREFFSNPGNFEQHVSRGVEYVAMQRTPSQATLDSLDNARYSEDGGGDRGGSGGDVAVLEFELRKARETINSLKANLTQFADGDSALDTTSKDKNVQRTLKPHEKRALNFLINEYLLLQDYKLTSITFSDENPDQDFEDWDDVGLIMPRPSGIVSLFWGNSNANVATCEASTETDFHRMSVDSQTELQEEAVCVSCQTNVDGETDWNHEILIQAEEIVLLKQKVIALETEKLNFQKLYDAAIVSLNSLTTPTVESKALDIIIPEEKMQVVREKLGEALGNQPITCTAAENHYGSANSTHSATPEQFEIIDGEKPGILKKGGSNTSSFDPARDTPRHGSATTLDETLSINDAGDWTRLHYECSSLENCTKEMWIDSGLPNSLKVSILNWCCEALNVSEPLANDLLTELVNCDKPVTLDALLVLVADTLPRIIPHTLVSRRCEAAALLACTIHLLATHESTPRRARLLQLLLTLLKKPDAAETRVICEAACLIVKWGGSGDVLSSIAELLTSRSSERRVLASQICVSIAPYVSIELCTSLLLSLVILMCESNETEVRSLGLKSACLVCPVAEQKYGQLEGLMFNFLKDPVEKNVKDTVNIFVPLLARTALIAGKFTTDLCTRIIANINKSSSDIEWKSVLLYLDILRVLVVAKLAYVVNVQIVRDVTSNCDMELINYQEVLMESEPGFLDMQCYIVDSTTDAKSLLVAMNSLIKEKPDVRWTELTWFSNYSRQILEIATNCKSLKQSLVYSSLITLFNSYVKSFGANYARSIIQPIFMEIILELEQKLEKLHAVNVDSTAVVGIYLVAVLPALNDGGELEAFLQKWIMYSSLRGLPVKVFSLPLAWVAKHKPGLLNLYLQHLREFAASSNESQSGASIRGYIAGLMSEVLNMSEVSDSSIESQILPAVDALLEDTDPACVEAGIGLWGACTRRGGGGEAAARACWARGGRVLSGAASARHVARAAQALALLVTPARGAPGETESRAISLLCALCSRGALGAEALCALAPGLQLAAHHAPRHPDLARALRKLEEQVQAPHLAQYKPSIEALIHNITGTNTTPSTEPHSRETHKPTTSNLMAAQEAVGRRVTQIFQQSKSNMNLPNIFKKKT